MPAKQSTGVRPKKSLGQHFLHDRNIANRIVDSLLITESPTAVLEIGPGMGVLTERLMKDDRLDLAVIEIDRDSVAYLKAHHPLLRIIEGDFLKADIHSLHAKPFSIIGNFPYNISSQIFFNVLEHRDQVQQVVCMLQKEVADRIAAPPGNKTYGILSVLLQAFYTIHFLFKVPPGVFRPPPKVMSAVIRLERNAVVTLPCDEKLFVQLVKQGFNNRRKTLRNALKNLILPAFENDQGAYSEFVTHPIFSQRAEQLSVEDFIQLTQLVQEKRGGVSSI